MKHTISLKQNHLFRRLYRKPVITFILNVLLYSVLEYFSSMAIELLTGIRVTASLLKQGRLVICQGCEDCLREMALYRWADQGGGHDAPCKENDHAMDDMRYFAATVAEPELRGCSFFAGSVERPVW